MRVKLLKDVVEGGRLKVSQRPGHRMLAFTRGTVIEMSEASAKKYIDTGLALETDEAPERTKHADRQFTEEMTGDERQLHDRLVGEEGPTRAREVLGAMIKARQAPREEGGGGAKKKG